MDHFDYKFYDGYEEVFNAFKYKLFWIPNGTVIQLTPKGASNPCCTSKYRG